MRMILGTVLAATVALSGLPALAQSPAGGADMSARSSNGGEGLRGYQQAEQRLTEALNGLQGGGQAGAVDRAREAVLGFQQTLTGVPDNLRSSRSYQQLVREVTEANGLFTNGSPDASAARRELEQVIAVTSQFRAEAGLDSSTPGGGPVRDQATGGPGLQQRSLGGQAPAVVDGQTGGSGGAAAPGSSGGR